MNGMMIVNQKYPFPLKIPSIRANDIQDERTKELVRKMEEEIGLIDVLQPQSSRLFLIKEKHTLFWNPMWEGYALIGKVSMENWIVKISISSSQTHYDIAYYLFFKKPLLQSILLVNWLLHVYDYFETGGKDSAMVTCQYCQKRFHWLDGSGDYYIRWSRLKEKSCGCY